MLKASFSKKRGLTLFSHYVRDRRIEQKIVNVFLHSTGRDPIRVKSVSSVERGFTLVT